MGPRPKPVHEQMSRQQPSRTPPLYPAQPAPHLEDKLISHRKRPVQLPRQGVDFFLKLLRVRQDLAETRVAMSPHLGWGGQPAEGIRMPALTFRQSLYHCVRAGWTGLCEIVLGPGVASSSACQKVLGPCMAVPHPFGHVCPYDPPSMAMAAHLGDLFLLLPDVAHNLQNALGIGQPGYVSGQGLQLRHLGGETADTPPGPSPHPFRAAQGPGMGLTSCL